MIKTLALCLFELYYRNRNYVRIKDDHNDDNDDDNSKDNNFGNDDYYNRDNKFRYQFVPERVFYFLLFEYCPPEKLFQNLMQNYRKLPWNPFDRLELLYFHQSMQYQSRRL